MLRRSFFNPSEEDREVALFDPNSDYVYGIGREGTKLWHLGPVALLEYISENH